MQRLAAAVNDKVEQMKEAKRQLVKKTLKDGAQVIVLGHHDANLPVLMRVTVPAHWHSHSNEQYLECSLPEGTLWKTFLWVKRNHPDAAIEIKSNN
jgi:hypothetical protein